MATTPPEHPDDLAPLRILHALHELVLLTTEDGSVTFASNRVLDLLGRPPEAVRGRPLTDLFEPGDHADVVRLLERGSAEPVEVRGVHANGRVVALEATVRLLSDEPGAGAVVTARDVTGRVNDRRKLQRDAQLRRALITVTNEMLAAQLDERLYHQVLDRAVELVPDAEGGSLILLDEEAGVYRFAAANGFDLEVLRTITLSQAELGRTQPPRVERIQVHDSDGRLDPEKFERFRQAGNLERIRVTLSVPILAAGAPRGFLNLDNFHDDDAFGSDAIEVAELFSAQAGIAIQRLTLETSLQAERARYRHLAGHDALTDLPNRRLFHDRLERSLVRARRRGDKVGLVYVDLDRFKQVNDRFGHAAGDALLRGVAVRLAGAVRAEDTVARLGGDEFAVLLTEVADRGAARAVAAKLAAAVQAPVEVTGGQAQVGASVGVALYPNDASDVDGLIRAADAAMYNVKRETRARRDAEGDR